MGRIWEWIKTHRKEIEEHRKDVQNEYANELALADEMGVY